MIGLPHVVYIDSASRDGFMSHASEFGVREKPDSKRVTHDQAISTIVPQVPSKSRPVLEYCFGQLPLAKCTYKQVAWLVEQASKRDRWRKHM